MASQRVKHARLVTHVVSVVRYVSGVLTQSALFYERSSLSNIQSRAICTLSPGSNSRESSPSDLRRPREPVKLATPLLPTLLNIRSTIDLSLTPVFRHTLRVNPPRRMMIALLAFCGAIYGSDAFCGFTIGDLIACVRSSLGLSGESAYEMFVITPRAGAGRTSFAAVFVVVLCVGDGEKGEDKESGGVVELHGLYSFGGSLRGCMDCGFEQ